MSKKVIVIGLITGLFAVSVGAQNKGRENKGANNVAGRTYCSVVHVLTLSSNSSSPSDNVFDFIGRTRVSFSDAGVYVREGLSSAFNLQIDALDLVLHGVNTDPVADVVNFYSQIGSRLDLVIDQPTDFTATWYVNADGSVIHGKAVRNLSDPSNPQATSGQTWDWTLVEGDNCFADEPLAP